MAPAWRCAKRLATASLQLFSVRQGAKTTGRLNQERFNAKKIEEEVKNKIHVPPAKSSTGRRNKKNLRNVWRNVNWDNNDLVEVELVEGDRIGEPPSPKWIYIDDTTTKKHKPVMPKIDGNHDIKFLSKHCKIIDFGESAGALKTRDGKIIAILSSKQSVENMGINNFQFKYGPALAQAIEVQNDLSRNPSHEGWGAKTTSASGITPVVSFGR